uniref:hypothetical protein n=1 Tax=Gemmiger formicilis TaxID=745368 RepID=UPI003FF034E2
MTFVESETIELKSSVVADLCKEVGCLYYGFFLVNASGLSIVNGGMTKKIALSTNIEWIYAHVLGILHH